MLTKIVDFVRILAATLLWGVFAVFNVGQWLRSDLPGISWFPEGWLSCLIYLPVGYVGLALDLGPLRLHDLDYGKVMLMLSYANGIKINLTLCDLDVEAGLVAPKEKENIASGTGAKNNTSIINSSNNSNNSSNSLLQKVKKIVDTFERWGVRLSIHLQNVNIAIEKSNYKHKGDLGRSKTLLHTSLQDLVIDCHAKDIDVQLKALVVSAPYLSARLPDSSECVNRGA